MSTYADKQVSLFLENSVYCSSSEGESCKSTNTSPIHFSYYAKQNYHDFKLVHNSDW